MLRGIVVNLLVLVPIVWSVQIDLNGDKWIVSDSAAEYVNLSAKVPGGIYTDLHNNNYLDDIFFGYNDVAARWVARKNWTYSTKFNIEDSFLSYQTINIVFEGLDTISEVFINGKPAGKSQNMFVRYIFDVKRLLSPGENSLEVRFLSPIEVGGKLAAEQAKSYVVPPVCPPDEFKGECYGNQLRKMQASFSWDWGPAFPSVGIWKPVFLEAYNSSVLRYLVVNVTDNTEGYWVVSSSVYFASNPDKLVLGQLITNIQLDKEKLTLVSDINTTENSFGEIVFQQNITIYKGKVSPWWPNGYGFLRLYNLTVQFTNNSETSQLSRKIGFRKVELVQEPTANGLTFYFKVNDLPVFVKGSNEIPINVLPERGQNVTVIRKLLESARDANMNMLRVWGGGVYESDEFYNIADELGIMIWQDFMFACALYPTNDDYISNVISEVQHQVKRLEGHPSVVLYSGNNENEGMLSSDYFNVSSNFSLYKNDYVKLYITTIQKEFKRISGNALFVSSSPSNGLETASEGYVAKNPQSSYYGDVHFYNYVFDGVDSNIYPFPRFASEYGYQSLPSVETFLTATEKLADLDISSDFMAHRQHHPGGNVELLVLMNYQLNLPPDNSSNYFKAIIYYSQIIQALSVKVETEHYRIYRSNINEDNQAFTMGALYWQLNDVWVAPTWAGIDYTGRWKMLHYFARNFFAPITLIAEINSSRETLVYLVNDELYSTNVIVQISVINWNNFTSIATYETEEFATSGTSRKLRTFNTDQDLAKLNCGSEKTARNNCFFKLTLLTNGQEFISENYLIPTAIKKTNVQASVVEIEDVKESVEKNTWEVTIKTSSIALFVWLDSHDIFGTFSDNGFLMAEEVKVVQFKADNSLDLDTLKAALTVTHLLDQQYF